MPRAVLCLFLIALYTIALGVPSIVGGLFDRRGRFPWGLARTWARLMLQACAVRVVVSGAENLPAGPALYAANHGSALDIPILFGYLPVEFRIIHKRSLYLVPIVGLYLYLGGHIGIDRGNAFRARKSLDRAAARIRRGTNVAAFPEGTRSRDESVRAFKRGSFVLAFAAEVPVVPVSLVGVKRVTPVWGLRLRPGTVQLKIHPPLATAGRQGEDSAVLAEEVRTIVAHGCGQG